MTGKWGPDTKYWGGTVGSGLFAEKLPAGLPITIAVTVSFQLTVLIQVHPHPKAGERCAF